MGDPATLEANRRAWEAARYEAWVAALGEPAAAAAAIRADPRHTLRRLIPFLGDIAGQRILNLQGSHGRIAVALAMLGAAPTVVDFSEENRRYALAMADAAGVVIDYRTADVMTARDLGLGLFDQVVMELGILHYHQDLPAFFALCADMVRPGGRLVLNEFHPTQRKLFSPLGTGDYFAAALVEGPVPYPPGLERPAETCLYRFYTLAEILTAALGAGWGILRFEEHPDWDDARSPGTFTLLAERI